MMSDNKFKTIVHAFADSLEKRPDEIAVRVIEQSGEKFDLSYADLYQEACRVANGFRKKGIISGDRLIIVLPTSREFFYIYAAAIFSGVIPIIVSMPNLKRPMNSFAFQLDILAKKVKAKYIVVPEAVRQEIDFQLSSNTVTMDNLCNNGEIAGLDLVADVKDIAHLQTTSGSTGSAKLAVIGHGNIAANVQAIGIAIQHRPEDVLVTWLPFSHDMGLIGISYALNWQCPLIAADPVNFIRNPIFWLRLISRFRGTLSPAPSSAFQICSRLARLRTFEDLDLSSWRVALCGAEPIHADTIHNFQKAFVPYGFPETTMLPVYGLAEATLAATISDINTIPIIESIDADLIETRGHCMPATPETKRQLRMVSVGTAVSGHQLRIVDKNGLPLGERQIGEVEFSGPSVINGYWDDRQNNSTLKREDGFLRTGDLGYLANRQLYITGRSKDIIIIHGRNFIPSQIEALIQKVINSNIMNGVAACGIQDSKSKTEMLHLIIELRSASLEKNREIMEERIRSALEEVFSLSGVIIHWVSKGKIPKTSSGKIQRYRCREFIQDIADCNL